MIIISDVHIGLIPPAKVQKLCKFLSWASQNCSQLVILGDGIDFWAGLSMLEIFTKNQLVFDTIRRISSKIKIKYIIGNHCYLLTQNPIGKEFGIEYYYPDYSFEIDGRKVYLTHGHLQSIERKLLGGTIYKAYLKWAASPLAESVGKAWYKWGVGKIANWLLSVTSKDTKDPNTDKRMRKEAFKILEKGYDIIMMGHVHHPSISKIDNKIYINTGDWVIHSSYVIYNKETNMFELKEFN